MNRAESTRDRLAVAHRALPTRSGWADDLESVIARCGLVVGGWLPALCAADPVWGAQHQQALSFDLTEIARAGARVLDQLTPEPAAARRETSRCPSPAAAPILAPALPCMSSARAAPGTVFAQPAATRGWPASSAALTLAETVILLGVVAILCWLAAETLRSHSPGPTEPLPSPAVTRQSHALTGNAALTQISWSRGITVEHCRPSRANVGPVRKTSSDAVTRGVLGATAGVGHA